MFTVVDSTVTMLIVSSHHATDSLSQLANQKPAFVGERPKEFFKTNLFDFNPTGEPASRLAML